MPNSDPSRPRAATEFLRKPTRGSLRWLLTLTARGLLLALLASAPAGAAVVEDFDDQNDSPPLTQLDVIDVALGGGPYVTWTFPLLGGTNYGYRIVADASATSGLGGPSRGASYDASPPSYTDFFLSADIVSWATPGVNGANGLVAARDHGPGTSDGYSLTHDPGGSFVYLSRLDDEVPSVLDVVAIALSPSNDYRFVVARSGTTLEGLVYQLPDLATPIVELSGTAATNWTDLQAGLLVSTISHLTVADATFDNLRSTDGSEDFDGDGLSDLAEVVTSGTSPLAADTDGDGLSDGFEVANAGFDPLGTDESALDFDSDGLDNLGEQNAGTNPNLADTDGDGLSDGFEVANAGFDPLGTDESALDFDSDGLDNLGEQNAGTNPNLADTDGDGLSDGFEVDTHGTNPLVVDTDGDGLSDGDEVDTHGTNPLVADSDGDGLSDGDEVDTHGTNPLLVDTDGDGASDGDEVAAGTDPLIYGPIELRDAELVASGSPVLQNGSGTLRIEDSRLGRFGPPVFVPEPGALLQLGPGVGLLALLAARRRRTASHTAQRTRRREQG